MLIMSVVWVIIFLRCINWTVVANLTSSVSVIFVGSILK